MSKDMTSSQPSPTTVAGVADSPAEDAHCSVIKSPSRVFRTPSKSEAFSLMDYVKVEMFGIGDPGQFEPAVKESIQNFFIVPAKLEALVGLGWLMALDAFLYVLTFLPIRVVFSVVVLLCNLQAWLCEALLGFRPPPLLTVKGHELRFHRTQAYDLMRGIMFLLSCLVMREIDMSQVYHFIRGQSFLKLYVLAGMMEVMDKLLSSFGQDCFDALHWQTRHNPQAPKLVLHFLAALCYVCLHSSLYFFVVATFTVVINSADEALVTVLVINNFSEIRSFVFKKFDGNNLFQLACSDITERFQISLFLVLICFVTMAQAGDAWREAVAPFLKVAAFMLIGESVADGMKHAFINKFNSINASVYQDFAYVLRSDILNNRRDPILLDHTYAVTRRLGMSQLPLGCVCVRYVVIALSAPTPALVLQTMENSMMWRYAAAIFFGLVAFKLCLGVALLCYADYAQRKDSSLFVRSSVQAVKLFPAEVGSGSSANQTAASRKADDQRIKARVKFVEGLAEMDRYTVYNGRVL